MCDVGSLIDCLYGIDSGEASLDILARYDEIRRNIFNKVVDVMSTGNFHRIMQDADDFKENDPAYKMMSAARADPAVAAAVRKVRLVSSSLLSNRLIGCLSFIQHEMSMGYDMTEFYDKSAIKE